MAADLYLGLMSGTSMDGLDMVVVAFEEHQIELLHHRQCPLPDELVERLSLLCQPQTLADELHHYALADRAFAEFCAAAVNQFLADLQLAHTDICAIGSHGQTVRHAPSAQPSYTLQLGDANTLAALTGIAVVADFRRKDIALGGQGAPLVPAFHQALFSSSEQPRAILNLGGIANVTWLPGPATGVMGFDTGPANTLLDGWFRRCHPEAPDSFDSHGAFAAQGKVQQDLLDHCLADDYFAKPPPKSTGRDDFNLTWLATRAQLTGNQLSEFNPADVQATLIELTARSVAQAINSWLPNLPETLFVCGGGAYNPLLMSALTAALPQCHWHSTAVLGVNPQHVEAMAFAWLARCYLKKQPGNLPAVTGASRPTVLGGLFLP